MRFINFRRAFDFQSIVFVLLCVLQLSGAAPRGRVDNCRGHKKFTGCHCDQFGVSLYRDEKFAYDEAGFTVHERSDLAQNSKKPYYYCQECKRCGDGVLQEYKCTQKSDTVCSNDKCTNETWVFNFVLKACHPPRPQLTTTTPSSTVQDKVTRQDTASVAAEPVITGSKVSEDELDSSLWFSRVIIFVLILTIVLFAVTVLMLLLVCCIKHKKGGLLASPSSSHNSSRESVAPAHV